MTDEGRRNTAFESTEETEQDDWYTQYDIQSLYSYRARYKYDYSDTDTETDTDSGDTPILQSTSQDSTKTSEDKNDV